MALKTRKATGIVLKLFFTDANYGGAKRLEVDAVVDVDVTRRICKW